MIEGSGVLTIRWSDRLEALADDLFNRLITGNPLAQECVVVQGRVMSGWLRHYFNYTWARKNADKRNVLANVDLQPLFVFVNDWLHRMAPDAPIQREARCHPHAVQSLQWRIYELLITERDCDPDFEELTSYLGSEPDPARAFHLAGQAAKLLDQYVVYRPDVVSSWESGKSSARAWQSALWRRLLQDVPESYLKQFANMDQGGLEQCGIEKQYQQVTVFAVPTMPPVYLHFFAKLAQVVTVRMLLFNPCPDDFWMGDLSTRKLERQKLDNLVGSDVLEDDLYLSQGNPILSSMGGLTREYLTEIISRDDSDYGPLESVMYTNSRPQLGNSVLLALQTAIRWRDEKPEPPAMGEVPDPSLQLHVCHNPLREVEVLHDHILLQCQQQPDLQPRDFQVQVTDLATYVPYIDAVFASQDPNAPSAIPYAIADRAQLHSSLVAGAFLKILELPTSRFGGDDVMALLECEAVQMAFKLTGDDVTLLRTWVRDAGIAWGRDADHRRDLLGIDLAETTWQQGLDRMVAGYALGGDPNDPLATRMYAAGALGNILPFNEGAEGNAILLGRFHRFWKILCNWADAATQEMPAVEWQDTLLKVIDSMFSAAEDSYQDIAALRRGVRAMCQLAEAGGVQNALPLDVVKAFVEDEIDRAETGDSLVANGVVFSALRTGSSTPRRIMCLLGMSDGAFPRPDNRPAFDLMRDHRRAGDPGKRTEDRNAFLEALMSARQQLYISYTGRSERENEVIPPATVVAELFEFLGPVAVCETLHRLQAFHPDYFRAGAAADARLISFSAANHTAAQALLRCKCGTNTSTDHTGTDGNTIELPESMALEPWIDFFLNPAKHYYRQVLQASFSMTERALLRNTELFELGGLDRYAVDQEILSTIVAGKAPDALLQALQQQSMAPLGRPGGEQIAQRVKDIHGILSKDIKIHGARCTQTLLECLQTMPTNVPIALKLGEVQVDGQIQVRFLNSIPTYIACRYADLKAKDILRAWLHHLFLCVSEEKPCTVCASSKTFIILPPVKSQMAKDTLVRYQALLVDGQRTPLPFTPATAWEWVKAEREGKNSEDKARAQWKSNPKWGVYKEDNDPYFRRAFGDAGPMSHTTFADHARTIFEPLLDHLSLDSDEEDMS